MKSIKEKVGALIIFGVMLALMVSYDSVFNTLSGEVVSLEEIQSEVALTKEEVSSNIQRPEKKIYLPQNISLKDTNGNTFLLYNENLKKPQIINIWASWCAPCLKELPSLFKLAKEYENDIRILAISIDENLKGFDKIVTKLKAEYGNNPVVIARDTNKIASQVFNTKKVPESFLVQSNGEITGKAVGYVDWQLAPISEYIDIK